MFLFYIIIHNPFSCPCFYGNNVIFRSVSLSNGYLASTVCAGWLADLQIGWLAVCFTDWLVGRLIDRLTGYHDITGRQTCWLTNWIDWLSDRLPGWLAGWLSGWLTGCLTGCLVDWLSDWQSDWLPDWLTGWMAICLVEWLDSWLTGWLAGCLAGWLDGWLTAWLTGWQKEDRNNSLDLPHCAVWAWVLLWSSTSQSVWWAYWSCCFAYLDAPSQSPARYKMHISLFFHSPFGLKYKKQQHWDTIYLLVISYATCFRRQVAR